MKSEMEVENFVIEPIPRKTSKKETIIRGIVLGILFAVIIILIGVLFNLKLSGREITKELECRTGNLSYSIFVVAADSDICSKIGCEILKEGGNIIDAAIGSGFCTGVVNLHSTGIGGGGFMVYYNKDTESSTFVDFRESAPNGVNPDVYNLNDIDKARGVGAVGVPSFVPGVYYIWKKYGKLDWNSIVEPSYNLLVDGFKFSKSSANSIPSLVDELQNFPELNAALINPETREYYKADEIYRDPILAETLRIIGENPHEFIYGSLGKDFFEDLCRNENISRCFLRNNDRFLYKVKESTPFSREIFGNIHYIANLSSSALVTGFIMKVIEYSAISSFDKKNIDDYSLFLHRFIEGMKFGYALRANLGDPMDIPDMDLFNKSINLLSSDIFAEYVAKVLIHDDKTNPDISYYDVLKSEAHQATDSGTSHLSIIDSFGNGVALTTTIGLEFGSLIRSPSTGIIYNSEMGGFSSIRDENNSPYKESVNNFILPGKRPISSISPTVIVDKVSKKAIIVSGASGSSRIISATSQVLMNFLLGNMKITDATYEPRVHHQFDPNQVVLESSRPIEQSIKDILLLKNHTFVESNGFAAAQTAVSKENILFAASDNRKNGLPYGI